MPVTALSLGPVWPLTQNTIYALSGAPCYWTAGAILQRSNVYAGPFYDVGTSQYNESGGFVRCLSGNSWFQGIKVEMGAPDSYTSLILKDNPSYYWSLDELSGTTAVELITGAHGTISGGVTLNQPGAVGKGMVFDGTTGQINTAPNVILPKVYTLECWLKTTTVAQKAFFTLGSTQSPTFYILAGKASLYDGAPNNIGYGSTININDGNWHYVVFVFDGSTIKCYIDGVKDPNEPAGTRNSFPASTAYISNDPAFGAADPRSFWAGSIDEVAIYPYALSAAQISAHYLKKAVPLGSYASVIMKSGPTNYWRLDEEGGLVANDIVGGKHGTISGGVTLNQAGIGKSMLFDGVDDKIVTPSNVQLVTPLTLETWIKATNFVGYRHILSTRPGNASNDSFTIYMSSGLLSWAWLYRDSSQIFCNTSYTFTDSQWHHLVVIFTSQSSKLYIDGVVISTDQPGPYTKSLEGSTSMPLNIGTDYTLAYHAGGIDEVAIYNRALSSAEIQSHYLAKFGVTNPTSYAAKVLLSGPSNYWRLNETSGTVANDIVGAANGTISGGVTLNGESGMTFNGTTGKVASVANVTIPIVGSVEAWFKTTTVAEIPIVGRGPGGSGPEVIFGLSSGAVFMWGSTDVTSPNLFNNNQWHHAVYIVNNGTGSIYVDGVLQNTKAFAYATPSIKPLQIGWDQYSGFFNGSIDEVAIYPRALSAAEILAHYQAR